MSELEPIGPHVRSELKTLIAKLHWTEKIEILDFLGWSTAIVRGFAGKPLILGQQRSYPHLDATGTGDTIDEAATNYFVEALTYGGAGRIPIHH